MKKYLILLFLVIISHRTIACLCYLNKLEEFYQNASLVVKGKLIKVDTIEIREMYKTNRNIKFWKGRYSLFFRKYLRAAMAVQSVYKTNQLVQDTIFVITPSIEDCGYFFVQNEYFKIADLEYIVFASSIATRNIKLVNEINSDKYYYTSNCYGPRVSNATDSSELAKMKTD